MFSDYDFNTVANIIVPLIVLAVILIIVIAVVLLKRHFPDLGKFETAQKRAGRLGEEFARELIGEILNEGDLLICNQLLHYDGKDAELDNVIINNRGVFIVEVKNYSGTLVGSEDDREWIKTKVTPGGGIIQKTVRNPIGQVRRQVYILSGYLKQHGFNIWVEGYVFLVERNSPVKSRYILDTQHDIEQVIHHGTNNKMTTAERERLIEWLNRA